MTKNHPKKEIITQQILKGNNISILTDTRLNMSDVRDLQEQLSVSHKVYSTANKYKRAGITIIIEKKINLNIDFSSNLTMEDGLRVLVISGSLPNKKIITISGVYVAPDNWKNSFTAIDNFLTLTYIKIKPGHIIEGDDLT